MSDKYGLDSYLSIHLSKNCNLKCEHCYQDTYKSNIINIDDIQAADNIFHPEWFVLYGGEPMIEIKTIREIIKKFPDKKYLIYTNGTIYDKDIFDRMDKIVITIESFFYKEAVKYRRMTPQQHARSIAVVRQYKEKAEILHNIYPTSHDKSFYRMARLIGIKVQSYPIIMDSEDFVMNDSIIESGIFHHMDPNCFPKMRLLEDGTLSRDMRGKHNLSHVREWKAEYLNKPLPVSPTCKNCSYYGRCPASSIFPHFVNDILSHNRKPHFCKMTEAVYGGK